MTKKMVKEFMKDIMVEGERVVDIDIFDDGKMATIITITKFHSVWRYVVDTFNGKINYNKDLTKLLS